MENKISEPLWLAFHVLSQKESKIEKIARDCGLKAYVPMENRLRRSSSSNGPREWVSYPIINGYLFIEFTQTVDWLTLSQIPLIGPAVGFNNTPAVIPPASMEYLLGLHQKELPHVKSQNMRCGFNAGDTVEIRNGVLPSELVKVKKIVGEDAIVFFKMLGVEEIKLPISDLAAA